MQDSPDSYNPSSCRRFQLLMKGLVRVTQSTVLSSCAAGPARAYALQSTGWFGVGKSGKGFGKHIHKDII